MKVKRLTVRKPKALHLQLTEALAKCGQIGTLVTFPHDRSDLAQPGPQLRGKIWRGVKSIDGVGSGEAECSAKRVVVNSF
jgi:hypothetical protein